VTTNRKKSLPSNPGRKPSRRTKLLPVRLTPEEYARLPRTVNLSRWVRRVLHEAAAGTRTVGPDLAAVHQTNARRAWLGALLDELLRGKLAPLDRLATIEQAAALVESLPETNGDRRGSCS
jgi:hypothetical protein